MKKLTLVFTVIVVLCLLVSTGNAQYEKGKSYLGPRVGIGVYGSGISLGAGYEYGVTDEISVGGLVDYYKYDWGFGFTYTYIVFGAQGNYHFGKTLKWDSKLDPFAGLVIGYESVSWSGTEYAGWSSAYGSGIIFGGQAGIRYFLSPSLALYGQVGFGITYLKVGVDFKF
ncbi:MAG: hypothetical protein ABSB78_11315 [Bacteroidota bacterium]